MNTLSSYLQKLEGMEQPLETAEEFWDQRAKTFYQNQLNGSTYFNDAVTQLLKQKGIITATTSLVDIGSGAGRYTIPLAKQCRSVHALDLSAEMLLFLQQETERNDLHNIMTIKSPWPTAENIGTFDVAFAAMCPATRSLEGLQAMCNVAKKHAVICQFTKSTDNVVQALLVEKLIEQNKKDPHNNRELLQAYFNILWELGFHPEISYLHDTYEIEVPLKDALHSYKQRYQAVDEELLKSVLMTFQQKEEMIKIIKNSTLAVLSWETEEKKRVPQESR